MTIFATYNKCKSTNSGRNHILLRRWRLKSLIRILLKQFRFITEKGPYQTFFFFSILLVLTKNFDKGFNCSIPSNSLSVRYHNQHAQKLTPFKLASSVIDHLVCAIGFYCFDFVNYFNYKNKVLCKSLTFWRYHLNLSHEKAIRANYIPLKSLLRRRLLLSWPVTQNFKQTANGITFIFASITAALSEIKKKKIRGIFFIFSLHMLV